MSSQNKRSYASISSQSYPASQMSRTSSFSSSGNSRGKRGLLRKLSGKKVPAVIKDYVHRSLKAHAEKKAYVNYSGNAAVTTVVGAQTPVQIPCTPYIFQGAASNQRIGDAVRVTRGKITGFINMLPYSATTNYSTSNILVRMLLVSSPTYKASTPPNAAAFGSFFDAGGSTTGWQGTALDMCLQPYKDTWRVHAQEIFDLGYAYNTSVGVVTSTAPNNDASFSLPFEFSFDKLLGVCKYVDNGGNCVNKGLWVYIQAVAADGSASSVTPCEIHYSVNVEYTDM